MQKSVVRGKEAVVEEDAVAVVRGSRRKYLVVCERLLL
jgi:hypothetical protein